jgi:PQQ-dependent catabolism-associated CXXCW motif protein
LEQCQLAAKLRCHLYAVDDRIVMPSAPEMRSFLDEATDFRVPSSGRALRTDKYHAATPMTAEGARTISTGELHDLYQRGQPPLLLDVLGGGGHRSLPGAHWLKDAGLGFPRQSEQERRFVRAVEQLTGGDRNRPVVVFCLSAYCWLSHNAAVRLADLGYRNVLWYRGGAMSWIAAGLPSQMAVQTNW